MKKYQIAPTACSLCPGYVHMTIYLDKQKRAMPSHTLSLYHWQGQVGSNHRVTESKSVALPLGYTPKIVKKNGASGGARTHA